MVKTLRLLLIDGHALAYRAYHALPPMTSPSGEPTNAVLGFANILLKAIQDLGPEYVAATFDVGRTFRHEEYAEYKATRAETPDDLRAQFGRVNELVASLGIPIFTKEGFEADDLLGTLSLQASQMNVETIIVTGDSDTFQLVSDKVQVLTPRRSIGDTVLYGIDQIRERYGLDPGQLIDLKAMVGDTSDNIPGVKGVGAKTATALLQQYGTLQTIYDHLEEVVPKRYRTALETGKASAFTSQHLITIIRDVQVSLDLEACRWGEFDRSKVMSLLRELGLHSLADRIPGVRVEATQQLGLFDDSVVEPGAPETCDYCAIDTREALDALAKRLAGCSVFSLDTETTGTDPMRARMVGLSVAVAEGEAWYIPVGHDVRLHPGAQLPLEVVQSKLGPIFADPRIEKACHNAKYDLIILARHGMPVAHLTFDTMIAAWLLDPAGRGLGLKAQAWQRLGIEMTPIKELIGTGRKQITMDQVSIAKVAPYAAADADMTLRLVDGLRSDLRERNQWKLFTEIEMPLLPILMDMQMVGMAVDVPYLDAMSRDLDASLADLSEKIFGIVGHSFNLSSPKQLGVVLFDELGLPVVRKTRTGYSTDAGVMEELVDKHPVISLILDHRQMEKLKGTYVAALPGLVNPQTGRVHSSFNQVGTSTGRLSSSDPNLQNIPVRTELGKRVRGAFRADEGHVLLGCDYSQVELRLLAHISKDPELLGAFHRDEDVHASTAAAILGIPLEEVTGSQRSLAKAINFGLMYGMSSFGLASRTSLNVAEANEFIETYFARFSRVRSYLDETIERAQRDGFVETLLGRRRYFPELASRAAPGSRKAAERAAINMPIQGSAADILKLAMIELARQLDKQGFGAKMVLQVHDELVLEVPQGELPQVQALVVDTMEHAYQLDVPLKVDVAVANNWMEMK